jgi:hypothetical protein
VDAKDIELNVGDEITVLPLSETAVYTNVAILLTIK